MLKPLKVVIFPVSNVEEGKDFYCRILPVEPIPEDSPDTVSFPLGEDARLVLTAETGHNRDRNYHIRLWSNDIEADCERLLKELHATLKAPISLNSWIEETDVEFWDPWGNIVVISGVGRLSSQNGKCV